MDQNLLDALWDVMFDGKSYDEVKKDIEDLKNKEA